ncbi:hypothetical protein [Stenotrophomonas sp.]|uniref:hypothetical protein n=1 Tax=Stenotrophomonas sp. TaxID=69392 RepID=UPI0028ADC26A|nr:hypothetical protein [Stenotrophomonas sp.]
MDDANDPHLAIRPTLDLLDEVLDGAGLENDARAQAALALEALDAGLGLDDVEAVLCGSIPGFAAARVQRPR